MIASRTNIAAPPTPWSNSLAEPDIHPTAYIHAFANIIGDVRIGKDVMIAPGISIRADEGSPFSIGERTNIQDGVVIHFQTDSDRDLDDLHPINSGLPGMDSSGLELPIQPQNTHTKSSHTSQHSQGNTTSPALTIDAVATISRLVAQGYGIFAEFANERRYKSNVWETGGRVSGRNAAEIVQFLTVMIGDRQKSYIRIVGVDQKARQRIVEQVIYRPIK